MNLEIRIFSGDPIAQGGERFLFDLSSMKFPPRAALDYDHDDGDVVGYLEEFAASAGTLTARGVLFDDDDAPNPRAREIAWNLRRGVPYEASALVDLDGATETVVKADETIDANGRAVAGPLTLFQGATLRGAAICPHGADANTSTRIALCAASPRILSMKGQIMTQEQPAAMAEPSPAEALEPGVGAFVAAPEPDPADEKETVVELARDDPAPARQPRQLDDELTAFIEEFGLARGFAYYRDGYSLTDARYDDYCQIREKAVADEKKREEERKRLEARVKELEAELTKLSAIRRGDNLGLSSDPADDRRPADPVAAMAARLASRG